MSTACERPDTSLQKKECTELCTWLNGLNLNRPKNRIYRDFSDGYLCATIIKKHYPNYIDLHNYIAASKFVAKINNWKLLKSKVLKKLNIRLTEKTMEEISNCVPGVVDHLLFELMKKIQFDFQAKSKDGDGMSSDGSWYDVEVIDENSEIMIVPIRKKIADDKYEVCRKKVVSFESYESIQTELAEKLDAVDILRKKVDHFEELLKTKDTHIEELQKNLSKKALRSKKNEIGLLDAKETLDPVSELNYVSKTANSGQSLKTPQESSVANDLQNIIVLK